MQSALSYEDIKIYCGWQVTFKATRVCHQRNKEHNMHACISYCSNCYVDSCLGKYLVSLVVLYAHVTHFHFVEVYLLCITEICPCLLCRGVQPS